MAKASIPSNSLASLYTIVQDAADRQVLSADVTLTFDGWDECNAVISEDRITRRIARAGAGVVFLVGVQTNQFPRALDMARAFRARGLNVAIGGFHVSGYLTMLPELSRDLQEAIDLSASPCLPAKPKVTSMACSEMRSRTSCSPSTISWPICRACRVPPFLTCRPNGCSTTRRPSALSTPVAVVRFSAASAPSSTCKAASHDTEPLTTSSDYCVRTSKRASPASSATMILPEIAIRKTSRPHHRIAGARSSGLARRPDPGACPPRACSARLYRSGNRQAPAEAGGSAGTDAGAAARRIS